MELGSHVGRAGSYCPWSCALAGLRAVRPCPSPGSPAVTGKALPACSADAGINDGEATSGAGQGKGAGLRGGAWGSGPGNPDVLAKTRRPGWSACFLGGKDEHPGSGAPTAAGHRVPGLLPGPSARLCPRPCGSDRISPIWPWSVPSTETWPSSWQSGSSPLCWSDCAQPSLHLGGFCSMDFVCPEPHLPLGVRGH